jgi:beta-N-acetylhexosaminidase
MLGFNLNLAPVVDVGTTNPQLWERTFGSTPTQVTTLAGAYLAGLQQSGEVAGTLKHFPGLGSTTTDPHFGLPILHRSRADWERIDLEPYRVLIGQQQVRAILVTHELIPTIDPNLPASLSPTLITGVLRQQLGFQGVVIDDSLTMGALIDRWTMTQAAVLAVKAGADMIIGPYSPETVQELKNALQGALSQGTLTRADIDQAVERDLTLKLEMHLIPMPASSSPLSPPVPGNRLPPPVLDLRR